jgi:hypothetical protein
LHLAIVTRELRACVDHSLGDRSINRNQAELIPSFVDSDIGHGKAAPPHHLAGDLGGVTLSLHTTCEDRVQLNALPGEVFAQKPSLLVAQLGKHIIVVARSSLRMANQVDKGQIDNLFCDFGFWILDFRFWILWISHFDRQDEERKSIIGQSKI